MYICIVYKITYIKLHTHTPTHTHTHPHTPTPTHPHTRIHTHTHISFQNLFFTLLGCSFITNY